MIDGDDSMVRSINSRSIVTRSFTGRWRGRRRRYLGPYTRDTANSTVGLYLQHLTADHGIWCSPLRTRSQITVSLERRTT